MSELSNNYHLIATCWNIIHGVCLSKYNTQRRQTPTYRLNCKQICHKINFHSSKRFHTKRLELTWNDFFDSVLIRVQQSLFHASFNNLYSVHDRRHFGKICWFWTKRFCQQTTKIFPYILTCVDSYTTPPLESPRGGFHRGQWMVCSYQSLIEQYVFCRT